MENWRKKHTYNYKEIAISNFIMASRRHYILFIVPLYVEEIISLLKAEILNFTIEWVELNHSSILFFILYYCCFLGAENRASPNYNPNHY